VPACVRCHGTRTRRKNTASVDCAPACDADVEAKKQMKRHDRLDNAQLKHVVSLPAAEPNSKRCIDYATLKSDFTGELHFHLY
jgi:hypothetical protein